MRQQTGVEPLNGPGARNGPLTGTEVRIDMNHETYADSFLRDILISARTIAVVGASPRRERPSHRVMAYLQRRGYRAIPVNPNAAGTKINAETCYARLADIPEPVDMVDVFRKSQAAGRIVDEAIAFGARVVWLQLGVRDEAAAGRAEAHGLKVVMNRCPAIEIPRLGLSLPLTLAAFLAGPRSAAGGGSRRGTRGDQQL